MEKSHRFSAFAIIIPLKLQEGRGTVAGSNSFPSDFCVSCIYLLCKSKGKRLYGGILRHRRSDSKPDIWVPCGSFDIILC